MATMSGEKLSPNECPRPGCPHTAYSNADGSEICPHGDECPLKSKADKSKKKSQVRPKDWSEQVDGYRFTFNYDEASGDMLIYDEDGDQLYRLFNCTRVSHARAWARGYNSGRKVGKVEGFASAQYKMRIALGIGDYRE